MTEPSWQQRSELARLGFLDVDQALHTLQDQPDLEAFLGFMKSVPSPDSALHMFAQLHSQHPHVLAGLSPAQQGRLALLAGFSRPITEHLIRHPENLQFVLAAQGLPEPRQYSETFNRKLKIHTAENQLPISTLDYEHAIDELRIQYFLFLAQIGLYDLELATQSPANLFDIATALSGLADAVLISALAIARIGIPQSQYCDLIIYAMGKCGGRELNYLSDVDVLFMSSSTEFLSATENLDVSTQLAQRVMNICSQVTSEGSIWQVDANLRPEGKQGALVRTLDGYLRYYQEWAQDWEFQALLKVRHIVGGDTEAEKFLKFADQAIWTATKREGFVQSVQSMREQVLEQIPVRERDREIKLGKGGLRDVEFSVQLLQLVHGCTDVMIHSPNTLLAIEQLSTWGYIGRTDAAQLIKAYQFLRTLEHRIQLHALRRTHLIPTQSETLRIIGRSLGFHANPEEELISTTRAHMLVVRRIHEKLFFTPLLDSITQVSNRETRLTPDHIRERLIAMGFRNHAEAVRHIEALTNGVSRRASIQRSLLPVYLEWLAASPNPDMALLAFRNLSDALGNTPWFVRFLRDESAAASRLIQILGTSKMSGDLLRKAPELLQLLAFEHELSLFDEEQLRFGFEQLVNRDASESDFLGSLFALRRRELFRLSAAYVLDTMPKNDIAEALATLNDLMISTYVDFINQQTNSSLPFIVIALGRYGGLESGFASDADVMFCSESPTGASPDESQRLASKIITAFSHLGTDLAMNVDAHLRPEGKNGPLVRTLDGFANYYATRADTWEYQALLRARVICGDSALKESFLSLIDDLRYPIDGIREAAESEIRALKMRMEKERAKSDSSLFPDLKMSPGCLSDIEWLIQLLQLKFGRELVGLRTTNTLTALSAVKENALLPANVCDQLFEAWRFFTHVRNLLTLLNGKPTDVMPKDSESQSSLARAMSGNAATADELQQNLQFHIMNVRTIFLEHFYGADSRDSD